MSLTLHEQLTKHIEDPDSYSNVFPNKNWTLDQYQEMFEYIGKGWLVQSDSCGFIVNPEWEGEPMWEPEEEKKMVKKEEEKVNGCEVDRCDATGKCTLDKCFYEEE